MINSKAKIIRPDSDEKFVNSVVVYLPDTDDMPKDENGMLYYNKVYYDTGKTKIVPKEELFELASKNLLICGLYAESHIMAYAKPLFVLETEIDEINETGYAIYTTGISMQEDFVTNRCLPKVTAEDNGKVLKVVNGVWTAVAG